MRLLYSLCLLLVLGACARRQLPQVNRIGQLHLLGRYQLPHNLSFGGTTVGGLSGIDYDPRKQIYYLICDDRSAINPARFYTAAIDIADTGIRAVAFRSVHFLRDGRDSLFPSNRVDINRATDPESIRFHPSTNTLYWSSEGERIVSRERTVLQDPSVQRMDTSGFQRWQLPLPPRYRMQAVESGPRQNGVFEGLSFSPDFRRLWVNVEEPLYNDGSRAGGGDSSGLIRFMEFDLASGRELREFAYRIDPVAHPENPRGSFKVNGVPEFLAINDHQFLVLERSFSTGRAASTIRIYLADRNGATDVLRIDRLSAAIQPMQKRLLLDMDQLGFYVDNVEGICFGPRLPDGRQTLVLVADNNFAASEISQFFVFTLD